MDAKNTVNKVFVQLQLAEKELAELEQDFAQAEADRKSRLEARRAELPAAPGQPGKDPAARNVPPGTDFRPGPAAARGEGKIEELRHLLLRIKEEASANLGEALLKEKEGGELKKEAEKAREYILILQNKLKEKEQAAPPEAGPGAARPDHGLTAESDRAHEQVERERQEFKEHYDALERDFEAREKKLIDEIRALRETETKRSLEYEKLNIELTAALERKQAAESKASSEAIEMMELNVYNKSAAAALREKDMEISDLKQALESAKAAADRSGGKP
jgi:hypothetical protein